MYAWIAFLLPKIETQKKSVLSSVQKLLFTEFTSE